MNLEKELLSMKLNAFEDEDDAKRLEFMKEIGESKNSKTTATAQDIEAIPQMLEEISDFISKNGANAFEKLGLRESCNFVLIMKEFAQKLKPIYIKVLLYKELMKK